MDDFSFQLLQIFETRQCLNLSQLGAILNTSSFSLAEHINFLRGKHWLRIEPNHALLEQMSDDSLITIETPLVITVEGKAALNIEAKERTNHKLKEVRNWASFVIAVLALILSAISIIWQIVG